MQDTERDEARAGAEAAQGRLLSIVEQHRSDGSLSPGSPSRLPGWTRGHVLTHLARNSDSIVHVLAAGGEAVERYPGGVTARNAAIEAGAARTADELVADVRTSGERLVAAWHGEVKWDGRSIETTGGDISVADLVRSRWRELEVHTVDLDLGVEPSDWPALFVRTELRLMEMRWAARRPMGLTTLPAGAFAVDPARRLAWLYGRIELDGLPAAHVL